MTVTRAHLLPGLLLLTLTGAGGPAPRPETAPAPEAPTPPAVVRFLNEELLSNPTREGVSVSLVPAEPSTLYVEYGAEPGRYTWKTEARRAASEERVTFRLGGPGGGSGPALAAGGTYVYRVRTRKDGQEAFGARREHRFRTLRDPGDPFTFAFATDSHVYQAHSWKYCRPHPRPLGLDLFLQTMENLGADEAVDFLIVGGDEVQTHCGFCPPCSVDGESAGEDTVRSAREAELRYRLMRRYFERVGHRLPFFYTLGNHDGEAGFGDDAGTCAHRSDTRALSMAARLKYLPNPSDTYPGGADGNYFSFESGDALFVVLDVMRYTKVMPETPAQWTLGAEQLAWLEGTLARSRRAWKFLFIHHLVGGSPDLGTCYAYGRGGLRSTDDGLPTGTFLGEQAAVQALMERYGAQILFYGHDHVFAVGEKPDARGHGTGVHYIAGGKPGGGEADWIDRPAFRKAYDYDLDGTGDFRLERGYVRVTVHGTHDVLVEYVQSVLDGPENGEAVFRRTIPRVPSSARPSPD